MTRLVILPALLALASCDLPAGGALPGAGGSGGFREYLVLGASMSFEQCRARGGLIIQDRGSPMVACDPRVVGAPVPADEFDHPGSPVPQPEAGAEAGADG